MRIALRQEAISPGYVLHRVSTRVPGIPVGTSSRNRDCTCECFDSSGSTASERSSTDIRSRLKILLKGKMLVVGPSTESDKISLYNHPEGTHNCENPLSSNLGGGPVVKITDIRISMVPISYKTHHHLPSVHSKHAPASSSPPCFVSCTFRLRSLS